MADRNQLAARRNKLAAEMTHRNSLAAQNQAIDWNAVGRALESVGWEMTPGVGDWIGWDRGANNLYQAGKQIAGGDLSGAKRLPDAIMDMAGAIPGIGDIATGLKGIGAALPALATVWHGSPHRFDKFDISKIGTGEGAQAYGHGLYLADRESVAAGYRDRLSTFDAYGSRRPKIAELDGVPAREFGQDVWEVADTLASRNISLEEYKAWLIEKARTAKKDHRREVMEELLAQANRATPAIEGKEVKFSGGNLYKVDLPDSAIANMLDWDAPLSEQPEGVREAFRKAAESGDMAANYAYAGMIGATDDIAAKTGNDLYRRLVERNGWSQEQATQYLNSIGIPGIKYFDGGSRTAGEGTRNYVVFDDSLLNILERQ